MAFREFTDSTGVVWQVWDVTVDQIHPVTRGEDFMADMQDGWLAFESPTEKRRMAAPYPSDWTEMPLPALEALCRRAPVVSGRKPRTPSSEHRAYVAAAADKAVVEEAQRTFTSPQGREWTVRPHECLDKEGNSELVLRFTADDIVVDLPDWPRNWRDLVAEQYALLLLDAKPPRRPGPGEKAPQRRREDRLVRAEVDAHELRDQPLAP
jgi:hypothetical protein